MEGKLAGLQSCCKKLEKLKGLCGMYGQELIGWKERLESSLKKVDEGLGVFMGLGLYVVDKVEGKGMVELRSGPKCLKNNKVDGMKLGLDRGPVIRPGQWTMEG